MNDRTIYVTDGDHRRLTALLSAMEGPGGPNHAGADALRRRLERAVVVPSGEMPYHVITMQSEFLLKDLDTGITRVCTLAYPNEAVPTGRRLSVLTPVGAALLGSHDLDVVETEVPAGRKRFRVGAVFYQPEAAEAYRVEADSLIRGSRRAGRQPWGYSERRIRSELSEA